MYEKIIIALLLSGYIFTSTATSETPTESVVGDETTEHTIVGALPSDPTPANPRATEHLVTTPQSSEKGARKQIEHMFSEPVIIVIILGVLAGIIGTILLFAYGIGKLTKKRSLNVESTFSHDTDAP